MSLIKKEDRLYIENKYHNTQEPFDPYQRRAYNGYEYDPSTGLTTQEIKEGLKRLEPELEKLPHPVAKAKAIAYVIDNDRIDVNEHDYFGGLYTWNREIGMVTVDKWNREVFQEKIPETDRLMKDFNASGAIMIWPDYDHVIPDWESLMKLGFPGILNRAEEYHAARKASGRMTEEEDAFYEGIRISYEAILKLVRRYREYALTKSHEKAKKIAASMRHLEEGPPQDIFDAMQLIYLYFMISESIDYYQVRSLGNGLDRTLYPFYLHDLETGTYKREEISGFMADFMMQWSAIGNYWGQPFYLGGTDSSGKNRINDLSYDILEVYSELGIYNPKIQIKVSHDIPEKFLHMCMEQVRNGDGNMVFCCEPGMRRAVMKYGATYEEAVDFDIRGCYETGVRANEVVQSTGYINGLKTVLYVLSNGFDDRLGKQLGLSTGELSGFRSFEDFYEAFLKQLTHLIDSTMAMADSYEKYMGYVNPSSIYSGTIVHSLECARDGYQDGVRFNNSAILIIGFATMIDALMAVKELVYDKKEVSLTELREILKNDWEGHELLRMKALNSVHKYGNADPITDAYADAVAGYFTTKVDNTPNTRGGVYKAVLHAAMAFVWLGEKTGATPDGRKAGEEMSKNGSPTVGMDRNGVTALIHSATGIHLSDFTESACVDVMLHPSAVQGEDGLKAMESILMTYLDEEGMSIQFNVFDEQKLLDAQEHPEKYRTLQVRVCGWNVLWNNLSRKEQDAYIKRARNIQD